MRFVKRILGEVDHGVVDTVGSLLADAVGNTALDAALGISVYEALALRVDDVLFFLAHRTADVVRLPHRISRKLLHDLHNLLLIHDTAIGRL